MVYFANLCVNLRDRLCDVARAIEILQLNRFRTNSKDMAVKIPVPVSGRFHIDS